MDSNEPIVTPPDLLAALEVLEREWRDDAARCRREAATGDKGFLNLRRSAYNANAMIAEVRADQLAALLARYAEQHCVWTEERDDESGAWATACGEMHIFIDGGPVENKQVFCGYCGKPVQVAPPTPGDAA